MKNPFLKLALALTLSATSSSVLAHVSFVSPSGLQANKSFKAVFSISHGCEGEPTRSITLTVPEGVIAVKPRPDSRWKISRSNGDYAQSYQRYGKEVKSGVKTLTWEGKLEDDEYDEFTFHAYLTSDFKGGDKVYFPVVQTCANNSQLNWTDTSGKDIHGHGDVNSAPYLPVLENHQQEHSHKAHKH
ncbi:MAG: YcnI family protein [Alcaligenaceae bacterium]|nr:YcnI family protein [Alcaligenaceae bacterium]